MIDKNKMVIILGTAHLGTTAGKCSPNKLFKESVFSREIVNLVKSNLLSKGYRVMVDFEPIEPNSYMQATTQKVMQQRELAYRAERLRQICQTYGAGNCIYVSIHVDAAGADGNWHNAGGWSAYTTKGVTRSDRLAECLYDAAEKNLQGYKRIFAAGKEHGVYGKNQQPIRTDRSDGDRDMESNLYVLVKAPCPAVLTENLFQDNKSDVSFLMSEEGKRAIEQIHVDGILKYLGA